MLSYQLPQLSLLLLLLLSVLPSSQSKDSSEAKNSNSFVNLPPEWSGWLITNDTQTPSGRVFFNWNLNMKRLDSQLVTGGADWQTTIWDYNSGVVTTLTPDGTCRQSSLLKAPGLPEILYSPEIKSKFVNYTVFNDELVAYSTFKTPTSTVGVYTDVFVGNIVRIVGDNTNEIFQSVVVAPQDLALFLVPSVYGNCDGSSAATQPRTRPAISASFEGWVSSATDKNVNGSLYVDWIRGVLRFDQMQSGSFSLTLVDQSKQSTKTITPNNNNNVFICDTTDITAQTDESLLLSSTTIIQQLPAVLTPAGVPLATLQWQGIRSVYGHLCNWWSYEESVVGQENATITTTVYQDVFTQDIILIESGSLLYSNFAPLTNQFYLFTLPSEWDCTGADGLVTI